MLPSPLNSNGRLIINSAPFPGAEWHEHEASCHYRDYRELPGSRTAQCPPRHPESGSEFALWHSAVAVAHVWAWYPNPKGPFAEDNHIWCRMEAQSRCWVIAMHAVVRKSRTQSSITVLRACSFADRCGDFLGVPPPTRVPLEHNVRSTWIIFGVYLFVRSDPEA